MARNETEAHRRWQQVRRLGFLLMEDGRHLSHTYYFAEGSSLVAPDGAYRTVNLFLRFAFRQGVEITDVLFVEEPDIDIKALNGDVYRRYIVQAVVPDWIVSYWLLADAEGIL